MAVGYRYLCHPRFALHIDPPSLQRSLRLPPSRSLHLWTAAERVHLGRLGRGRGGRHRGGSGRRRRRRRVHLPVGGRRVGRSCCRRPGSVRVGPGGRLGDRRRLHRRRHRHVAARRSGGTDGGSRRRYRRCSCFRHVGRRVAAGVHVGRVMMGKNGLGIEKVRVH